MDMFENRVDMYVLGIGHTLIGFSTNIYIYYVEPVAVLLNI